MKRIGLLCPVFSLPNLYGIGDFSECAFKFIDYLAKIRYSCWQILPINPTDIYGSPYTSVSSFAIDDIYVSLPDLKERGLITDIAPFANKVKSVNYKKVRKYKEAYFNLAFDNFIKLKEATEIIEEFKKKAPHVVEYANYLVLKRINKTGIWNKWNKKELKLGEHELEVNREIFKQYILFEQWNKIHQYAKSKNIEIIGDLPFYVGYDSADVFYNRGSFLLDEKFNPTLVAGVPPDYYSEDGQLWGNPIYDWEYLRNHQFKLIAERILHASEIYDVIRLDHFRAFDTYYEIPASSETARVGEWKEAPGYEFFDYLYSLKPNLELIAEDLGDMREEVFHLRDHFNLPGMQVIQFTLVDEEIRHHTYQYINHRENSIIYISTHDSYTGMRWIQLMDEETRNAVTSFLDTTFGHHHIMTNLFNYVANQPANTVILSIPDVLRLAKSGRINVPGVKWKKNWTFRFKDYAYLEKNAVKLLRLAKNSGRAV